MSKLINEQLVQSVSEKIADKKYIEMIRSLDDEIFDLVSESVSNFIPKDVVDFCFKYSNYCRWATYVTLTDNITTLYSLKCKSYPSNRCASSEGRIVVSTEAMSRLQKLISERRCLKDERSELIFKINRILLSFTTLDQIQVNFPEAYSYIEEALGHKLAPTPDILEVRNILNSRKSK